MANLLTPAEENEIRAALKDVLDTFGGPGTGTTITLRVTDDISFNPSAPFGEKRELTYTDYQLPAMVMYNNSTKSKEDPNFAGAYNNADVKCFVHLDYVEAAGLLVNDYPTPSPDSTILLIDNDGVTEKYRVVHISPDGALGKRQIYMVVLGEREEIPAS